MRQKVIFIKVNNWSFIGMVGNYVTINFLVHVVLWGAALTAAFWWFWRHLYKQGHSRRLQVCVKPVQNSGTLPLLVEALVSVSIGCVSARSTKLQRPLDSYQVCGAHTRTHTFYIIMCNLDYKPTVFKMIGWWFVRHFHSVFGNGVLAPCQCYTILCRVTQISPSLVSCLEWVIW